MCWGAKSCIPGVVGPKHCLTEALEPKKCVTEAQGSKCCSTGHCDLNVALSSRDETICQFVILPIATSNIAIYCTIAILVYNFMLELK